MTPDPFQSGSAPDPRKDSPIPPPGEPPFPPLRPGGLPPAHPGQSGGPAFEPCPKAAGMVSCQSCADFLMDYLDGLLPEAQRFSFDSHLALCRDCAVYLDSYRAVVALVQGLGEADAPGLPPPPPMPPEMVRAILEARRAARP